MSGVRLDLANPNSFDSPKEYIEKHLAPIAIELHRLANEMITPGASSEDCSVDMIPNGGVRGSFRRLDKNLVTSAKHVVFDGSEYFSIPRELLRSKQLKVQFTAVVYVTGLDFAEFQLVTQDSKVIANSLLKTDSQTPVTLSTLLPFGDSDGCIASEKRAYFIEGRTIGQRFLPVCRRFSLSFVYI